MQKKNERAESGEGGNRQWTTLLRYLDVTRVPFTFRVQEPETPDLVIKNTNGNGKGGRGGGSEGRKKVNAP